MLPKQYNLIKHYSSGNVILMQYGRNLQGLTWHQVLPYIYIYMDNGQYKIFSMITFNSFIFIYIFLMQWRIRPIPHVQSTIIA